MVCWSQAGLILPLCSQYCVLTSPLRLSQLSGAVGFAWDCLTLRVWGRWGLTFISAWQIALLCQVCCTHEWMISVSFGGEVPFPLLKKKKRVQDASDRMTRTIITTNGQVKRMLQIAACDHLIRCIEACELMSPYSCLKIFCVWVKT